MSTTTLNSSAQASRSVSPFRSIGIWMSVFLVGYMFFNTARALLNPVEFAASYGAALTAPDNTAFVFVYAIRAFFLALFGAGLLLRRNYGGLALYALIGAVMPLGDAMLVAMQGAGMAIVIRHLLTAVFLVGTAVLIQRWQQRSAA